MSNVFSKNLIKLILLTLLLTILSTFLFYKNKKNFIWFNGDYELAKTVAGNRIIMLEFYADWWLGCKKLDAETFSDYNVINLSQDLVSLKLNIEEEKNLLLSETFGVNTIPQNIFVKSDGKEIGRIEGFLPPDLFVIELQKILKN